MQLFLILVIALYTYQKTVHAFNVDVHSCYGTIYFDAMLSDNSTQSTILGYLYKNTSIRYLRYVDLQKKYLGSHHCYGNNMSAYSGAVYQHFKPLLQYCVSKF